MAIFWRALDEERNYLMRAAMLVRPDGPGDASVVSARRTRRKDYERENRKGKRSGHKEISRLEPRMLAAVRRTSLLQAAIGGSDHGPEFGLLFPMPVQRRFRVVG